MSYELLPSSQQTYIPAVTITSATFKHSWGKLPVATMGAPERVCGEARRIGYTGKSETDFAIYRLKIKSSHGLPTVTLPSLYVIKNGFFVEYI
ncbi:MAG: hypothetical protein PVS3B3_35430 [Ktedonobacteraceae bacterium]